MPFVWKGGEGPILERRRRERGERRLAALDFKWFNSVAGGDWVSAVEAALEWRELAGEVYGDDFIRDETEAANDL